MLQFPGKILVALGFLTAATMALTPVVVTGASGRTGRLVFRALVEDPRFEPKAIVRSEKSAQKLRQAVPQTRLDQIVVCDVVSQDFAASAPNMVICSSSVPVISKRSLARAFLLAPWNLVRGKKAIDFRSFRFKWQGGQYPEMVDYLGAKKQIDAMLQQPKSSDSERRHIVLVGSMGGTDPSNFLNSVGKDKDGKGNGDILVWKRRAEQYLVEQAQRPENRLDYTILHPGGLTDEAGDEEDFVLDVNDKLLERKKRSIARADVAALCVAALVQGKGRQIALDCITQPKAEEDAPRKSAEEALEEFTKKAPIYDYAL